MSIALDHKRRATKLDDHVQVVVWDKDNRCRVSREVMTYSKAKTRVWQDRNSPGLEHRIILIPAVNVDRKPQEAEGEKKQKEHGGRRPNAISLKAAA